MKHRYSYREATVLRANEPIPQDPRDWRRAHLSRHEYGRTALETRQAEAANDVAAALSFLSISNGMGMPLSEREYTLERKLSLADEEMMAEEGKQ